MFNFCDTSFVSWNLFQDWANFSWDERLSIEHVRQNFTITSYCDVGDLYFFIEKKTNQESEGFSTHIRTLAKEERISQNHFASRIPQDSASYWFCRILHWASVNVQCVSHCCTSPWDEYRLYFPFFICNWINEDNPVKGIEVYLVEMYFYARNN